MRSKKLTKSGGITIPADLRRNLNLQPGDAVDIDEQGNKMIISAHINRCFICREELNVVSFLDIFVCEACIKAMGEMIDE